MNSIDKRNSVKDNYDKIADLYCGEFGVELEDQEVINEFVSHLKVGSSIVDLGGGSGKLTNYFINKGYKAVCYDFSENMMKNAMRLFPNTPYILDDIVNIKDHFEDKSLDGIIAFYSLFHIPRENIRQLFVDANSVLKDDGIFCFSFQLGNDEMLVDEPFLKENGKEVLYMNYINRDQVHKLVEDTGFDTLYEIEKHESGDNVIGEDGNDAVYVIAKKRNI